MTTPRKLLVDSEVALCYHISSKCVRGMWLCGQRKRRSYEHRKTWLQQRLLCLAEAFAIDVLSYAIMSNHFHLIVYYEPLASQGWSDEEVVERWLQVYPPRNDKHYERRKERLLGDVEEVAKLRAVLGDLSGFMKHLKQPIARRMNREDGVRGHAFDERFYSGALLNEDSVLTSMRYVELNPVRARIAHTLEQVKHTSAQRHIEAAAHNEADLEAYLEPVVSGTRSRHSGVRRGPHPALAGMSLGSYLRLLREALECERLVRSTQRCTEAQASKAENWRQRVQLLKKRQRAYGDPQQLQHWLGKRNMRVLEKPLP